MMLIQYFGFFALLLFTKAWNGTVYIDSLSLREIDWSEMVV